MLCLTFIMKSLRKFPKKCEICFSSIGAIRVFLLILLEEDKSRLKIWVPSLHFPTSFKQYINNTERTKNYFDKNMHRFYLLNDFFLKAHIH